MTKLEYLRGGDWFLLGKTRYMKLTSKWSRGDYNCVSLDCGELHYINEDCHVIKIYEN